MRFWNWFRRRPQPPPFEPAPPLDPPADLEGMAEEAVRLLNRLRSQERLPPLSINAALAIESESHARWMHSRGQLSHLGFSTRLRDAGFASGAENIAAGQETVQAVLTAWQRSAGHRRNQMNFRYNLMGIGRSGNYWCLILAAGARS